MRTSCYWIRWTLSHLAVVSILPLLTACVSWEPGWRHTFIMPGDEDVSGLMRTAEALEREADTGDEVRDLIRAYQAVVDADPSHYEALWKIGNYQMLMGAAYSANQREKKKNYLEAVKYCERAMYTNPGFREAIGRGQEVWEACDELTLREIDAMGYWYTAIFYYFGECLSPMGRMMNTRLIVRIDPVINRINELDANWAGGATSFSRAIYYIAIPKRFGGDKEKAATLFGRAIEIGPDYLVNRWGRARYLYALTGDRQGYSEDLEWVLAQDPRKASLPYPWNVYFQRTAKRMLEEVETPFGG